MTKAVKVGKYVYEKSSRKDKKLMTKVNGKTIHFGDQTRSLNLYTLETIKKQYKDIFIY